MPVIEILLAPVEEAALIKEAEKRRMNVPDLIRIIVKVWLFSQGYGVE